jgi:IS4 transposase
LVQWGQSKRSLKNFFDHLIDGEERTLYHAIAQSTIMVVGKKIKNEFLVIASNVHNSKKILKAYRRRWDIERCFKNMKSQGFNLENTHMTSLNRLMKLMCLIAVAILIASLMGLQEKCPFKKSLGCPLYSSFTMGLRALKRALYTPDILKYLQSISHSSLTEG